MSKMNILDLAAPPRHGPEQLVPLKIPEVPETDRVMQARMGKELASVGRAAFARKMQVAEALYKDIGDKLGPNIGKMAVLIILVKQCHESWVMNHPYKLMVSIPPIKLVKLGMVDLIVLLGKMMMTNVFSPNIFKQTRLVGPATTDSGERWVSADWMCIPWFGRSQLFRISWIQVFPYDVQIFVAKSP